MRNIEIKAKVHNADTFIEKIKMVADTTNPCYTLHQTDYFFNTIDDSVRLKLRMENGLGYLICYARDNISGPKLSNYTVYCSVDASQLLECLKSSVGLKGIVEKKRRVWMAGQTRIHLDNVDNVGIFMELEVVLGKDQTVEEGQEIANDLMVKLGIEKQDLIECAYFDLLSEIISKV